MSATPRQYANIFVGHADGAAILEEMQGLFYDGNIYVQDSDRTQFNLGAREVIAFVYRKIAVAQQGDPNEEQES